MDVDLRDRVFDEFNSPGAQRARSLLSRLVGMGWIGEVLRRPQARLGTPQFLRRLPALLLGSLGRLSTVYKQPASKFIQVLCLPKSGVHGKGLPWMLPGAGRAGPAGTRASHAGERKPLHSHEDASATAT